MSGISEDTGCSTAGSATTAVRTELGFTDSGVACDVLSLPGSYISKKENSHPETSEGRMPRIHAVLPKQDITEAFSQAETDVVPCYGGHC